MAKGDFQTITTDDVGDVSEIFKTPVVTSERETKCVFISDGVYKYVYVDNGEDVV